MSLYICPKPIGCTTPRVSLKTNSGQLWCLSVGSSVITNVPLWWVTLLMGGAMHVWGQGVYGKSLYFLFRFYEHKLKIMSLKIKNNNMRNYHRCQSDVSNTWVRSRCFLAYKPPWLFRAFGRKFRILTLTFRCPKWSDSRLLLQHGVLPSPPCSLWHVSHSNISCSRWCPH